MVKIVEDNLQETIALKFLSLQLEDYYSVDLMIRTIILVH